MHIFIINCSLDGYLQVFPVSRAIDYSQILAAK